MKLLVTAFDPFGGEKINPALEAAKLLPDQIMGWEIVRLEVPTVFSASVPAVTAAIRSERPNAVLMLGQAGGRSAVTPERVAINVDSARIADNAGDMPFESPIKADGPAAYFSTLPIVKMTEAIRAAGVPAEISNSAGTFVCNHLMYGVLDFIDSEALMVFAGFMHVPFIPEQTRGVDVPSLPLESIVTGVKAAIEAIISVF